MYPLQNQMDISLHINALQQSAEGLKDTWSYIQGVFENLKKKLP